MSGAESNIMNQAGCYSISGVNDSGDITLAGTIDSGTSKWIVDQMYASTLQSGVAGNQYMKNSFITR